ncbi:hypothetical protein [Jiangella asiatica]|uniref:Insertion element protein n=1 Tax=Jiangella asiatica TaxID=2530372 RepID=A0A4R5DFS5_9ACTN|nr:hypothetical protein [Jiangella asiatica]TDE09253.1 hypothetical protein E1269_14605 [Jiangella asiatica]
MSETRAAIMHCPFCADEDLHPAEALFSAEDASRSVEQHGGWECRSCLRVFSVKLLGLSTRRSAG